MKLKLKEPSAKYKKTFCDYVKDYIDAKEDFYANFYNDALEDFEKYLKRLASEKKIITEGRNEPYHTFWFLDSSENIVGVSRLRSKLNEWTKQSIGHIGFDVRPMERRKGYASQILALTLGEAKKLGHKKILIICETDNIPSQKVIKANGGIYIDEITSLLNGNNAFRYEILLS